MSRVASLALRIVPAVACLAWVLWGLDLSALGDAFAGLALSGVGLAVVPMVGGYTFMGWRLRTASGGAMGLLAGIEAGVVGHGLNNLLPAKAGELGKIWYLRRRASVGWDIGLGMVFWERTADANALLALGVLGAFVAGPVQVAWPLAALVAVLWVVVLLLRLAPSPVRWVLGHIPFERPRALAHEVAVRVNDSLTPSFLVRMAGLTAAMWCMFFFQVCALVWVAAGLPLTLDQIVLVCLALAGASAVPSTPGAVGLYEAAMVAGLSLYGVPKAHALALALVHHAMLFLPSLVCALALLSRHGLSLEQVRDKAKAEKDSDTTR